MAARIVRHNRVYSHRTGDSWVCDRFILEACRDAFAALEAGAGFPPASAALWSNVHEEIAAALGEGPTAADYVQGLVNLAVAAQHDTALNAGVAAARAEREANMDAAKASMRERAAKAIEADLNVSKDDRDSLALVVRSLT